jgi:hypothetical protein
MVVTNVQTSINTADELNEFVSGINFQGILPNEMSIDFTPNEMFAEITENNFSTADQGLDFSIPDNNDISIDADNFRDGRATLTFDGTSYTFPFVICTSVQELSRKYPQLNFSPYISNYLIFIGMGNSKYSELEIIEEQAFQVIEYFQVFVDPDEAYAALRGYFSIPHKSIYRFYGNFNKEFKVITSIGEVYYPNYSSYTLELHCE